MLPVWAQGSWAQGSWAQGSSPARCRCRGSLGQSTLQAFLVSHTAHLEHKNSVITHALLVEIQFDAQINLFRERMCGGMQNEGAAASGVISYMGAVCRT
eukprot:3939882-Rhodomonas_salina.1